MSTDNAIIQVIDNAFGDVKKPQHFTSFTHCEECADHDETLRNNTRETISLEELGNPGWDPLCFSSGEGIAYYMPSLARLALQPETSESDWYGDQLVFHLEYGGSENKLLTICNSEQRKAILALLKHIIETRTESISNYAGEDDFLRAYELWENHIK